LQTFTLITLLELDLFPSFTHPYSLFDTFFIEMSALRRSGRIKTGQPGIEPENPSLPDLHGMPAAAKKQQIGGKPKGNTVAPKPKLVAESTDVLATGSGAEAELKPVSFAQSVPCKWGRQTGQGASENLATEINEPVEKKLKIVIRTVPKKTRANTRKPIPQRSPLPQRIKRVVQPARPDMPRRKRTSSAVAAAEAEEAKLLWRLEELDRQKKLALAEMELNEEEADAEEERTAVQHLEDLPDSESGEPPAEVSEPRDGVLDDFLMDEDERLELQAENNRPFEIEGPTRDDVTEDFLMDEDEPFESKVEKYRPLHQEDQRPELKAVETKLVSE
jgi:hypothetical protein